MMTAHHPHHKLYSAVKLGFGGLILCAATIVVGTGQLTFAQANPGSITLTAIPPRLGETGELTAKPGEVLQTTIQVRNASNESVTLQTTTEDFILSEDGFSPIPVDSSVSNRWSLASWVTLSATTQTLAPQQTAKISVVISIPEDALPGGHYAMVIHTPNPGGELNPSAASSSRVAQRVGSLLYVKVDGPINEEAFVRNLDFPQLSEYGPVPFSLVVENVSDIHIRPQIGVEIFNLFNQKVDTITLETKNVFPYVPRTFSGTWNRVWGIGPYTARVTMSYGSNGQVAVTETTFWLFPVKLVLIGMTILVALVIVGVILRRTIATKLKDDQRRIDLLEQKLKELKSNQDK